MLWVLAVLLAALGLYHLVQCFLASGDSAADRWKERASQAGRAVVFAALGAVAATVAMGARPNGDRTAETASRDVLGLPGGPVLLALIGAGVLVGGVVFAVRGVRQSFTKKLTLPAGRVGRGVTMLGVVGYVAEGIALAIVGVLPDRRSSQRRTPRKAGGLDAAVHTLLTLLFGPFVTAAAGIGFVAYGVSVLPARYAKL